MNHLVPCEYIPGGGLFAPIDSVRLNSGSIARVTRLRASGLLTGRKWLRRADFILARYAIATHLGWRRYLARDWAIREEVARG